MPDDQIKNVVFDTYRLRESDDEVQLTVTIGFAQDANAVVKIDDEMVDTFDGSFSVPIGTNNSLHAKILHITCLVQDVQEDCNIVSAHAVLTGGRRLKDWTVLEEPTEDHETYPLSFTIGLFK